MKTNSVENSVSRFQLPKLTAIALGGLLLTACAGNPPKEQFAVTESAVREAVSAGGTRYAPVEMRAAQEKWRQAELAMQKEEYEQARKLAEQRAKQVEKVESNVDIIESVTSAVEIKTADLAVDDDLLELDF